MQLFACWVLFILLLSSADFFLKINFFENSFRNPIRMPNSFDHDKDLQNVGPDLGPNCFQRRSVDDKVAASKGRVNTCSFSHAGLCVRVRTRTDGVSCHLSKVMRMVPPPTHLQMQQAPYSARYQIQDIFANTTLGFF